MFDQEHAATTKEKTRQPYAVAGFSKETDVWLSLYGGALRVVRKPSSPFCYSGFRHVIDFIFRIHEKRREPVRLVILKT